MVGLVKGDVVVVPFPFSNLQDAKRRPAVVVSKLIGGDLILCMITSQVWQDGYSIDLKRADFLSGGLVQDSCYIRPNRLFTAEPAIVAKKAGRLSPPKLQQVVEKIIEIVS